MYNNLMINIYNAKIIRAFLIWKDVHSINTIKFIFLIYLIQINFSV